MMKKITEIEVQSMADEIDHNVWEPAGRTRSTEYGRGKQWIGSEVQTLIRHVEKYNGGDKSIEYSPCEMKTPLDDLCLPGFRPTNLMFMYPEAMKTLVWFVNTYGGKYARAHYFRTPPGISVGIHLDAQPDKFGPNAPYNLYGDRSSGRKVIFYYKKERFHVIIDGSFEYTVDYEEEDRIYEYPVLSMTQPVTKTFSKGEVWWFNNKRPHTSHNNGTIPKINLVFDVKGSSCLTNLK